MSPGARWGTPIWYSATGHGRGFQKILRQRARSLDQKEGSLVRGPWSYLQEEGAFMGFTVLQNMGGG